MTRKSTLIGTTILGAACLAGAARAQDPKPAAPPPAAASADAAVPTGTDGTNDIIVTATRRASSLQTTPAAITALSPEALRAKSVTTFEDLGRVAPGVQVSTSQGFAQVYIRGIGTPLRGAGLGEGSTALLTDGIYKANAADSATPYYDVERIEVLRGPQGTLYGRNATSGAINVITRDPTDEFEGDARLTLGNYDRITAQGAIGGPVAGDAVRARVAFIRNDHKGYQTLIYPDGSKSDAEDQDDYAIRGKLDFRLGEDVSFLVTSDNYHADDKAVNYQFLGTGFVGQPAYEARYAASQFKSAPDSRTTYTTVNYINRRNIAGLSGKLTWDFGGATLTSTTAYRKIRFHYQNDLGYTSTPLATQIHKENAHQYSEDLLLTSESGHFFEWIVGGSYFKQKNDLLINYRIPTAGSVGNLVGTRAPLFSPNNPTCCILDLSGGLRNRAYAGFADATLNISDAFKVKVGGRYTSERIGGSQHVGVADGATFVGFNVQPRLAPKSFKQFTPKASVEYRFSPTVFAYASYTKGFKSGGYNIGDFAQNIPFNPEKIDSYEVGLKTQLFDRRLTFNLSAFDYEYKDLQVQQTINNSIQILNAATARVRGIEVEGAARPWTLAQIDLSLVFLDAEFRDFVTINPNRRANGSIDLRGSNLPKAPDFSLNLGVQQGVDLGDGTLTARADWSHKSKTVQDIYSEPDLTVGATDLIGARLGYAPTGGHWDAALFVQNLANTKFRTNAFYGGGVIGSEALGQLNQPRIYGVEVGFRF